MDERILSGKICFPAGTIPSLEANLTFEIKYNISEDVEEAYAIYVNGELTFGNDSDWGDA